MHPPTPVQRIRRWHTFLVVWAVHRVLGLGVGALLLLMSVTGGLLVVHHELERWLYPDRHVVVPPGSASDPSALPRAPLTPLVQTLAAEAPPGHRPLRLESGHRHDESDKLLFVAPDGRTRWAVFINPYTGATLWRGPDQALFTPWLLHLHMHLRSGVAGYIVTGLTGIGLLLLGVTGLYIYRDRLSALWRHPMRLGQGWRIAFTDLHRWLGVVSIYFTIVLGLTGAIYAFKSIPSAATSRPRPVAAFEFARLTAIEPAVTAALERFPEAELFRIAFPATPEAPLTLTVLHRDAPVWRKFSRVEFDATTGTVRAVRDARKAAPGDQFASMLAPLHFGLFGSPLTKVLYAIGGFAPAALSMTGFAIWWLRTRRSASATTSPGLPRYAPSAAGGS
ncbi:MAG TPA: PepSY-associated TM helix domain-containing protein [Opitutaceae bacterium]